MPSPGAGPAPWESWTAAEWERRRARAAAYLATDPGWIVGPSVVTMYERGRDRARTREASA